MSCPFMTANLDPIADELLDKSLRLYPRHTVNTHLGCVILRIAMALLLIGCGSNKNVKNVIIVIIVLSILVFGNKYYQHNIKQKQVYWKGYLRMLVSYSSALALIALKEQKLAGMLIIADGLMGMNSRHTASALSCGIKKNNPLDSIVS